MPYAEKYQTLRASQKAYNYIKWCAERSAGESSQLKELDRIVEQAKLVDANWQKDHPRPSGSTSIAVEAVDAAVPMVPEADLDAAVALADETEGALRQELDRLGAAVLSFAHPLGVARNLAPLDALHTAQRALKAQQERDRDEAQQAQQEIADRDRALAELAPGALAEARRTIEELKREVGAATRRALNHERLVYELAGFIAAMGAPNPEAEAD